MRLFSAALGTETNTFSPLPTSLQSFKDVVFLRPGEHPQDGSVVVTEPMGVARRRAATEGFTLIEGSCFAAYPAGITNRQDYEFMRDEILAQLQAALPVDAVLLGMHGAMVAYGYDDVEGDILERVRQIVGPKCVIGIELDPHCHLTVKRVQLADVIVLYKEYPHTDTAECGENLFDLVLKTVRGQVKPRMSLYDCRQVGFYPTTEHVMRQFVDCVKEMEGKDGVLSISIGHGMAIADVPEVGSRVLVVMDKDKAKGDALAIRIGEEFVSMRGKIAPQYHSIDDGIDAALEFNGSPVVMADTWDNAGGGSSSDNTALVRRLIERRVRGAAVGPVWDPMAVRLCFDAGQGTEFALRFGGKVGPRSGAPIDAKVTVLGLKRDCWQAYGANRAHLGDCAAIKIGAVEIVLSTDRTQAFGPELFSNVGIDPLDRKLLVVKSANHFMAGFGPIAKKVIYVDSIGFDYAKIPYTRVAPIWPRDKNTSPGLIL